MKKEKLTSNILEEERKLQNFHGYSKGAIYPASWLQLIGLVMGKDIGKVKMFFIEESKKISVVDLAKILEQYNSVVVVAFLP